MDPNSARAQFLFPRLSMHIRPTVRGVRKGFGDRVYRTSRDLGVAKRSEQALPRPRTCDCIQGLGNVLSNMR